MTEKENSPYSTLAKQYDLLFDEPLKKYTSINIGGPADLLALPKDKQELKSLLNDVQDLNLPITLIGGGSNLLVSDKGIRGLAIVTKDLKSQIRVIEKDPLGKTIHVEAGERLSKVCQFAINQSLSGLEFAAGIPGSLGGAIAMNAGTSSGDMSGIIKSIEVINRETLIFETKEKTSLEFSYRNLRDPGIIVAAKIILKNADQKIIEETFKQNLLQKNATQPVSYASAGCFFKNPEKGKSAGELIEKSGLKGVSVNDAMVSKIHANYIVNLKNATCKDILSLKQQIQEVVFKKYNIKLETEVRMEGE